MSNRNLSTIALLAGLAAGIIAGAVLAQPAISAALAQLDNSTNTTGGDNSNLTTFEEEELLGDEFAGTSPAGNATSSVGNETAMGGETQPRAGGTIAVQGTASSPGEEAGPFQIIDLLPPLLDGNVYVGSVSFTATAPVLVASLQSYGVADQALNPTFGQLFVFPGIPNSTMIAPSITMPSYPTPEQIASNLPIPETFSATVPFAGNGLSVGRLDGQQFLISYTVQATVQPAQTVNNVQSAALNQTEIPKANVTVVSQSAFLNNTAYSPNPINVTVGNNVTWVNADFDPHTITSGVSGEGGAGSEFDSGYMSPQATFTHAFEDTGTFVYFCQLHPNMVGTVIVEEEDEGG